MNKTPGSGSVLIVNCLASYLLKLDMVRLSWLFTTKNFLIYDEPPVEFELTLSLVVNNSLVLAPGLYMMPA